MISSRKRSRESLSTHTFKRYKKAVFIAPSKENCNRPRFNIEKEPPDDIDSNLSSHFSCNTKPYTQYKSSIYRKRLREDTAHNQASNLNIKTGTRNVKSLHTSVYHRPIKIPKKFHFPYNKLKFYGIFNIKNKWNFLEFCKDHKIPCIKDYIHSFKEIGYKSKSFDSRCFEVIFNSCFITYVIHSHLKNLQVRHTYSFIKECNDKNVNDNNIYSYLENFDSLSTQNRSITSDSKYARIGT